MLALGVFLPLVLTALLVSWHNADIRNIGLALLITWAASNAIAIYLPFDYRPILYPLLQVMIGLTAMGAWLVMRFTPERSRPIEGQIFALAIVVFALANTAASVNYSLQTAPGFRDKYLFVLLTNLTFGAECLLVGGWGVRDAFARADGVARVLRRARGHPSSSSATQEAGSGE